jgi:hypothetical protein
MLSSSRPSAKRDDLTVAKTVNSFRPWPIASIRAGGAAVQPSKLGSAFGRIGDWSLR